MRLAASFIVLFLLCVTMGWSQNKNRLFVKYVETYKELAIDHQHRYRIPASITLAQGLLESGAGTGTLAAKSNNHFGIKCHNWTGDRTYHDDDLKGECFRKYRRVEDSFDDHSRFLKNNARYSDLFTLKITDYKGWARGLQRAGYATDKAYASKLINIIDVYELHFYDTRKGSRTQVSEAPMSYQVFKSAGLLYVEAKAGDNLKKIAESMGFKARKLSRYNEISDDTILKAGDIVYLEKKNRRAEKGNESHVMQSGESFYSIAQSYGIRLKNLYKMNKKEANFHPAVGDTLRLR